VALELTTAAALASQIIESKMEQFKVCEKETKTKAFSKEGLAQASRLDPLEKEKRKQTKWCQSKIDQLKVAVRGWACPRSKCAVFAAC